MKQVRKGKPRSKNRNIVMSKSSFQSHGKVNLGRMRNSRVIFETSMRSLSKEHQRIIIQKRDEYDKIQNHVILRGIDTDVFEQNDVKMASFAISSIIDRIRVCYKPSGSLSVDEIIDSLFLFVLKALGCRDEVIDSPVGS